MLKLARSAGFDVSGRALVRDRSIATIPISIFGAVESQDFSRLSLLYQQLLAA
jgi:hypothetical protein